MVLELGFNLQRLFQTLFSKIIAERHFVREVLGLQRPLIPKTFYYNILLKLVAKARFSFESWILILILALVEINT